MTAKTNPAEVIAKLHELAKENGYERSRMDRSQYPPGSAHRPAAWIEVGYAHFDQITCRFSDGTTWRYRFDKVDFDQIQAKLVELKGEQE